MKKENKLNSVMVYIKHITPGTCFGCKCCTASGENTTANGSCSQDSIYSQKEKEKNKINIMPAFKKSSPSKSRTSLRLLSAEALVSDLQARSSSIYTAFRLVVTNLIDQVCQNFNLFVRSLSLFFPHALINASNIK